MVDTKTGHVPLQRATRVPNLLSQQYQQYGRFYAKTQSNSKADPPAIMLSAKKYALLFLELKSFRIVTPFTILEIARPEGLSIVMTFAAA